MQAKQMRREPNLILLSSHAQRLFRGALCLRSSHAQTIHLSNHFHDPRGRFTFSPNTGGSFGGSGGSGSAGRRVVDIPAGVIGQFLDIKDLRIAARQYFKANLQGKSFKNLATGREIQLSGGTIGKIGSAAIHDPERLHLLPAIPEIIRFAELKKTESPSPTDTKTIAYHRFQASVRYKGAVKEMHFLVRQDVNGHWYYNHSFGNVK